MWTRPLRKEDRWHPLTAIAVTFVCPHAVVVVGGRKEPSLARCWGLGVKDEQMDRQTPNLPSFAPPPPPAVTS